MGTANLNKQMLSVILNVIVVMGYKVERDVPLPMFDLSILTLVMAPLQDRVKYIPCLLDAFPYKVSDCKSGCTS